MTDVDDDLTSQLAELNRRFMYHAPKTDEVKAKHEYVRDVCADVAHTFFWNLPEGREKSLAITKLEEAMFWANAAIARYKEE